ncbi:PAS domain-containing protein [Ramlibacter terrae]|uniref:histidine kinase n=1 Tax=Ramlibacter terrae TaxID=2732511 RepID=A0ABX6P1E7_9BURK|nr:PAS domain-containing protein [Ramlibacter terrae]
MLATLDSLTDGFITLDRGWRITYFNPAAEAGLDMRSADVLGRSFWDVFPGAPGTEFEENYRAAMAQGEVRRFDALYPPLNRWYRVSAFPSEQGIALSFADITASHEAHQQLLDMNTELERRVRERTEELRRTNDELAAFTLAVAHELREPLAGIAGFSRAVEERLAGRQDQKTRHFLSRIRAGVTRMEGLMDALLELAHVGRAPLERRRVNLTALVECTVEILRTQEPGRDARVDVAPDLFAEGDARLLRTLVENLLGTVWRASAGQPRTVICVGRRDEDGVFYVRDNSADQLPVPAPDLSRPHELLRVDGEAGGDRLALASARRVIDRHGGSIWAETTAEGGQMFCFALPSEVSSRA